MIYPFNMIIHPRQTTREMVKGKSFLIPLAVVLVLVSFLEVDPYYLVLLQAVVFPLLFIAIWILMAGTAWLISFIFKGRVSFKKYVELLGSSFLPFFILAVILDSVYSRTTGTLVLPALRGGFGPLLKTGAAYFPLINWSLFLGLGAVYNGIVTQEAENYPFWKAAITALATVIWPVILIGHIIK